MFFDPTCKPETKADPFSLESLISWLEKQPADQKYDVTVASGCLIAQYLQAHRVAKYDLYSWEVTQQFGPWALNVIALSPCTFGAALERARAAAKRI